MEKKWFSAVVISLRRRLLLGFLSVRNTLVKIETLYAPFRVNLFGPHAYLGAFL